MKHQHMLKYIISSLCFVLISFYALAQNDSIPQDSIKYQNKLLTNINGLKKYISNPSDYL